MKLRFLWVLLLSAALAGCSPAESKPNEPPQQLQNQMQDAVQNFAEHGLSFSVPENWSVSGFSSQFDEVKNDAGAYDTRTFYALIDGVRTPILMVSRFAKEQWDELVKNDPKAEESKLGISKDGNFVYTYLVKNDITPQSDTGKKLLETLRKEAEELKDKIMITE
ncbi:MAG: hypothetical protein IJC88_02540 [Oscillospiraceae bacterium]|nr:hypothetical protein [Oscillospiraceae bacterium]